MNDSAITCDQIIDAGVEANSNDKAKLNNKETKSIPRNFNQKNITCKIKNFYVLLA